MAKLTRITNKIFGENATAIGDNPQIGQFGSALAGTYVGTTDVETIQALPAWQEGWIGAVTPTQQFPALPERTGVDKVLSYQTGYILQMGIPEFDNGTTYYTNSFCQVNGVIYKSIADNNKGNSPIEEDSEYWEELELSGYHPPLLSCMWSDHSFNDIQWLRADTFSWQDGEVYKAAYDELEAEYNAATSIEVEGDITFKRTTKGYKIADADQETTILEKYNNDGIAWYYIIDTVNKRFKLPRTKFGFEGLRTTVGDDINESLPNIKGSGEAYGHPSSAPWTGALFKTSSDSSRGVATGNISGFQNFSIDASLSSSTYKDNAKVQERATQMYLYFYVGEYKQSAIRQTAGLNTELFNDKLDLNAYNLNTQGREYVSGLGMPSDKYIDLTLGASGSTYTAPANGWFTYSSTNTGSFPKYFEFANRTANGLNNSSILTANSQGYLRVCIPVKRGDIVVCHFQNVVTENFKFVYAEGSDN